MADQFPFIADSDPGRIRRQVEHYADEGYTPPLCPWCVHWGTVGWAWTCDRFREGYSAGERATACEGFDRQLDMFGRTG